jgi:hypothetical protein
MEYFFLDTGVIKPGCKFSNGACLNHGWRFMARFYSSKSMVDFPVLPAGGAEGTHVFITTRLRFYPIYILRFRLLPSLEVPFLTRFPDVRNMMESKIPRFS